MSNYKAELVEYKNLKNAFLRGEPVELTESSFAVQNLRQVLEGDCCFNDGVNEIDVCGQVYWDERKTVAIRVDKDIWNHSF